MLTRLVARPVEKIWGRRDLPAPFGPVAPESEPVGEIWFEHPDGGAAELLIKYLFTSEKLSIQVHPGDAMARAAGQMRGKDEAWIVLRAERDAVIGLGLREPVDKDRLRAAALDGSIEQLLDWRPAAAGDSYYSPAGTVHALGPGLALIEVQQNADLTYRLYDYGRPRELHLDQGVEAADPKPYAPSPRPAARGDGREILAEGGAFTLERWTEMASATLDPGAAGPVWLIPVEGRAIVAGQALDPGSAWLIDVAASLELGQGSQLLAAYSGEAVRPDLVSL